AGSVEVDQRAALHVGELAGVFFEVYALEVYAARLVADGDLDPAALHEWQVILRDLIALDEVRVRVVLAIELRGFRDVGVQGKAREQRALDGLTVDDRQHARHAETDRTNV